MVAGRTSEDGEVRKIQLDWTDQLREALKYLVSAMLAAIPLYQRCPPPEEWNVQPEDLPQMVSTRKEADTDDEAMDVDQPDVEEEEGGEDEDEDFADGDGDASTGRSQKYVDGFINRPLTPEQTDLLKMIYNDIGVLLHQLGVFLMNHRSDDMQAAIELSAINYCFLYPQGMATMNDVRMEVTNAAISNIRRAAFIVKGLGKAYYPEAILVQRVEGMHRERVSHNCSVKPARTWWQDALIEDILALTTNPYVDVRRYRNSYISLIHRAAQGSLYGIVRRYKKWAPIVIPPLIRSLQSTDIDTVKGALHTLHLSTIEHAVARNWEYAAAYVNNNVLTWQRFDRVSYHT